MRRYWKSYPKNHSSYPYFLNDIKTNCLIVLHVFSAFWARCLWGIKGLGLLCLRRTCCLCRGRVKGLSNIVNIVTGITMLLGLCLGLFSCSSYKKITYFKDLADSGAIYTVGRSIDGANYQPLVIQPDDILQVIISTIDPEANEAFNIDEDRSSVAKSDVLNMSKNPSGYLVNKNGDIELPVLGRFHVVGLTTEQIKDTVLTAAAKLLKQPVVNVRLTNFTVNVLGEVTRPGSYMIAGEKASLLDALSLAGDMTIYGKRDNVILMRTENGVQKKVARFDLNNTAMLSSPYFYLRQGDVIYVEPTKAKAASTDMSATKTYAIAGSVLSVLLIVISRL